MPEFVVCTSQQDLDTARENAKPWRVLLLADPSDPGSKFAQFFWNPATSHTQVIYYHGSGDYDNRKMNHHTLMVSEALNKIHAYLNRGYQWSAGRTPPDLHVGSIKGFRDKLDNPSGMPVGTVTDYKEKLKVSLQVTAVGPNPALDDEGNRRKASGPDPYDNIVKIVEIDDDEWAGYDEEGNLVATMDKEGAFELYEERPHGGGAESSDQWASVLWLRPA